MTELTPEQKHYTRKRLLGYGIALAVVIIALTQIQRCNGEREASAAYKAIEKRLNSVLSDSAETRALLNKERKRVSELELSAAEMSSNLVLTTNALVDVSEKNKQLSGAYKKARAERDTVESFVLCDSMASEIQRRDMLLRRTAGDALKLDSLHKEQEKGLKKINDTLQARYDRCLAAAVAIKTDLPKIKPRGQLYFTGGGLNAGPVFGATGGFTYITKNGLLIAGKGAVTNYGSGGVVELGLPLNLKRK